MAIKFVSWNVLADVYAMKNSGADPAVARISSWPHRSTLVKEILCKFDADIFALQEVDHYRDFYLPTLAEIGMKSIYLQRPQKKDGCLIAYRKNRFDFRGSFNLDLDCLTSLDDRASYGRSKYEKNNVAHFAHLFDQHTGQELIAANCHIHWNPNVPEVKLAQVTYILSQLALFKSRENLPNVPVIWAGDFNSLPDSEVYAFLTSNVAERESKVAMQELLGSLGHSLRIDSLYGPNTKFLIDLSLSKLTRWLRILGVYAASVSCSGNSTYLNTIFQRVRRERRVFLTTSKGLLERSLCPPFSRYINPSKQAEAMVDLFRDFGLALRRDRFLTVCGKCGGEISEAKAEDLRLLGKIMPTDRTVYACLECAQPYWWSEEENSSPAKALRKAEELYTFLSAELGLKDIKDDHLGGDDNVITTTSDQVEDQGNGVQRLDITPLQEHIIKEEKRQTSAEVLDTEADDNEETAAAAVVPDTTTLEETVVEESDVKVEGTTTPSSVQVLPLLRSVFPDSGQSEPLITNWCGGFKGTLDYILVAGENIRTRSAVVIPSFDLSGEGNGGAGGEEEFVVRGPQPSQRFPSDHFAVAAEIELLKHTL